MLQTFSYWFYSRTHEYFNESVEENLPNMNKFHLENNLSNTSPASDLQILRLKLQ